MSAPRPSSPASGDGIVPRPPLELPPPVVGSGGEPLDATMRERMLNGQLYRADDPLLVAEATRTYELTHHINTTHPTARDELRALFVELLGAFGPGSVIRPPFRCDYGYRRGSAPARSPTSGW